MHTVEEDEEEKEEEEDFGCGSAALCWIAGFEPASRAIPTTPSLPTRLPARRLPIENLRYALR
jgi:hypothetical protein